MNENGVWRTIRGRRVFIKDGEDLSSAMERSGKFDNLKRRNVQMEQAQKKIDKLGKKNIELYKKNGGFADTGDKEKNKQIDKAHKQWLKNAREANELKDMYSDYSPLGWEKDTYNNPKEYTGDISDLEGKHIAGRETKAREIDKANGNEKGKKINETMNKRQAIIEKLDNDTKDLEPYDKYNLAFSKLENNAYSNPTERQYWAGVIERYNNNETLNKSDSSPMSEWSDTTGSGLSDKQSTALSKMSMTELRNMANDYNIDTKGKSKKQLLSALISMFNK